MTPDMLHLLGIPFAEKKCLALVTAGLAAMGIPWQDPWSDFAQAWDRGERLLEAPSGWERLPVDAPLERGDVVLSRNAAGDPRHVSLALGSRDILHTSEASGSVITRARVLRGRIEAIYRRRPQA